MTDQETQDMRDALSIATQMAFHTHDNMVSSGCGVTSFDVMAGYITAIYSIKQNIGMDDDSFNEMLRGFGEKWLEFQEVHKGKMN